MSNTSFTLAYGCVLVAALLPMFCALLAKAGAMPKGGNRDPRRCLVIEDALPGLQAGLAAGATVWGYCPWEGGHTTPEALLAAGAQRVLRDMAELPGLLRH